MVSEPRFRRLWKTIRLKMYLHSNVFSLMRMSLFCILTRMDQSQDAMEVIVESINPIGFDPSVSNPSNSARSEHVSTEKLLKISQDMERVLDQLTALRAPIDLVRKHRVEEFHGTSLEEFDKAEF